MHDQPLRILLIDDDEDSFLIAGGLLAQVSDTTYELEWASSFESGLEALRRGGFDACLLDYRLGEHDGLELFRHVRAAGPHAPIVMLTGQGEHFIDVQAMKAGAADFLSKDELDASRLERSLRYAIERQQLMSQLEALAAAEHRTRLGLERAHEELKTTYEELKVAQDQVIRAEKLAGLGQLVAGVAHEINNPLAFVTNNVAVLQRDVAAVRGLLDLYREADGVVRVSLPALHQRILDCAERIDLAYTLENLDHLLIRTDKGLKRIQHIVQALREFARDPVVVVLSDGIDLNEQIESALPIIGIKAKEHGVALETDLAPLPPVRCCPDTINRVIINLVSNAIDASVEGGKVIVSTRPAPAGVEVQVLDTGSGIDPTILEKIFDPFFTTKPQGEGMGLGLSISHGIVAQHGGRITVDSTPGQGTHFTVFLPVP